MPTHVSHDGRRPRHPSWLPLITCSDVNVAAVLAVRADYMTALFAGSDVPVHVGVSTLAAHPWLLPRKEVAHH